MTQSILIGSNRVSEAEVLLVPAVPFIEERTRAIIFNDTLPPVEVLDAGPRQSEVSGGEIFL